MSESDELVTYELLKDNKQNKDADVDNEDAVCCECNVSYEDDARNGYGEEWVHCAGCIHENCIDGVVKSRPTATIHLHDIVNRRIEILGFAQEERDKYISTIT